MHITKTLLVCVVTFGALMAIAHGEEGSDSKYDFILTHECEDDVQKLVINLIEDNITRIVPRGCNDAPITPGPGQDEFSFTLSKNCDIEFKFDDDDMCRVTSKCVDESDDDDGNSVPVVGIAVGCAVLVIIIVVVIIVVVVCRSGSSKNDDVFQDDGSNFSISDDSSDEASYSDGDSYSGGSGSGGDD